MRGLQRLSDRQHRHHRAPRGSAPLRNQRINSSRAAKDDPTLIDEVLLAA
jgi:hypothetical protein